MVLGLLAAVVAGPSILGITEGVRIGQYNSKREEHRGRRCQLMVGCLNRSKKSQEVNGRQIVLRNSKLYVDTISDNEKPNGFPFAGYYYPYPGTDYEGLVSRISNDPPMLNWIYVDLNTYEVKYGIRADTHGNLTGPFDCTRQDRRLTLEAWEGFAVVEEEPGVWALYFDRDSDGLESKMEGKKVLEVELTRKEQQFVRVETRKPSDEANGTTANTSSGEVQYNTTVSGQQTVVSASA